MSVFGNRRRNEGPSDLKPFDVDFQTTPTTLSDTPQEIFLKQGISAQASGSSYLEIGNTKLLVLVHGPLQHRGNFQTQADVEVNVRIEPFSGIKHKDDTTRALSDFIRSSVTPVIVLKDYPKSIISIELHVLNGIDGAALTAASVNTCIMALVNAGITLHDMVAAVSMVSIDGKLYPGVDIDPQEHKSQGELVAVYSPKTSELVSFVVTSTGSVAKNDLQNLLSAAQPAACDLRAKFAEIVLADYTA